MYINVYTHIYIGFSLDLRPIPSAPSSGKLRRLAAWWLRRRLQLDLFAWRLRHLLKLLPGREA